MTPLSPPLGSGELRFWRLDQKKNAGTWDRGEGSFRVGGRWSPKGLYVVYASIDPATAILEVAVHKTFGVLDTVPHVLTSAKIPDASSIHIVMPSHVPNANWLRPGAPSAGQQKFGADLLNAHKFVLIPSAVSNHSWNLMFNPAGAIGLYDTVDQEDFALDTRLHPPSSP